MTHPTAYASRMARPRALWALFFGALLALALLFSPLAASAWADDEETPPADSTSEAVPDDGETAPEGETPTDGEGEGEAGGWGGEGGPPEGFEMPSFGDAAGWEAETTALPDTAATFKTIMIVAVVVLWAAALAAVIGVVLKLIRRKPSKKGLGRSLATAGIGLGVVIALVILTVGNSLVLNTYKNSMDALFTESTRTDSEIESSTSDWMNLVYNISAEGMVLLRNEGNALPLNTTKVNLLGYRAYDPVYSGGGSGSVSADNGISVIASLESAGFEINPAPLNEGVYSIPEAATTTIGFFTAALAVDEVPLDRFTGTASFEAMQAYSDVAIIVIGRTGSEGYDLTAWTPKADGRTYLQFSQEEEALIRQARRTFGTVIVAYNAANAMELGLLEEVGVDGIILTGIPGPYGFYALGPILKGDINPSGSLVDTYVYDVNSNPVQENYSDQLASNGDAYYVDYVEGIYVGYKWYETAYAEGAVITNTDTGTTYNYANYDSIVMYPFGYGLSYTTFTQEITDSSGSIDPHGQFTVDVLVTNTGSVAGKEPVQVYLTAPYTDYDKANLVEKAAVSLAGFGKTSLLEPGASETVTVTIDIESVASYDRSYDNGDGTYGAYMLDAGDYIWSVRSDAHTELDSVTVRLGSNFFYSGGDQRESDDQQAYNQFDNAARGIYLSRQNGFANYAAAMGSVTPVLLSTAYDDNPAAYDPAMDEGIPAQVEGVDYNAPGDLTVADLTGLPYDDPLWDELLNQLTIEEIVTVISGSIYATAEMPSVGKPKTTDVDGPLGISSMFNSGQNSVSFPSVPVLAATFNKELARLYGNYIADQAHSLGISGWYAPAMNIHRSPFSGRNFEYYSEDATLSAGIVTAETYGAREKGLVVFLKHFAFNDMESNRSGNLHTYINEQAIREIYLKPFEYAVKDGGATAIMSAMNYIGDVYVSASEPLLTQVLRNEWGFRGEVLTDVAESSKSTECAPACIRAGTDFWLAMGGFDVPTSTDADIYYLKRLAHDILYTAANAQVIKANVINWQAYLYAIDAALAVLVLAGVAALVLMYRKPGEPALVVESGPAESPVKTE